MTEGLTVDRADPRPLYQQIADAIARQIEGRTLVPGEALPSEAELQRTFGVARSVVRQALARLAETGAVQRSQGRIGIVAPGPVWRRELQRAGGFDKQLAAHGQTLTTRLLSFGPDEVPADGRAALGTADTWLVERVRSVDGVPAAFVRNWVPRALFPDLDAAYLADGSLHEYMRAQGIPPYGGRRHVQAVPADEYLAGRLEVALGAPLLLLEGTTRDLGGRGLEWFSVWHRGHTVFDVDAAVAPVQADVGAVPEVAALRETADRLTRQLDALSRRN